MIIIEFEDNRLIKDTFPNNIPTKNGGEDWHIANQKALMFKGDSKYPDKFFFSHMFPSTEKVQEACKAIPIGRYILLDDHVFLDSNNRNTPTLDIKQLIPLTSSALDHLILDIENVKKSLDSSDSSFIKNPKLK